MLRWRLFGSSCLILFVLAVFWLDDQRNLGFPGAWLAAFGAIVSAIAASEIVGLFADRISGLRRTPAVVASLLFSSIAAVPVFHKTDPATCPMGVWGWAAVGAFASVAVLFLGEMFAYREARGVTRRVSLGLLAALFVTLPFCFLLNLRLQVADRLGLLAVISIVFVVKSSDAGAYFSGRLSGRNKLAPLISPGKTIEGALGGVLFAILAAWFFHAWLVPRLAADTTRVPQLWSICLYGGALAIVGIFGDLSVSMLKRDAGQKDSGNWIPGLGGILDVLDSLVSAAPAAYLIWSAAVMG